MACTLIHLLSTENIDICKTAMVHRFEVGFFSFREKIEVELFWEKTHSFKKTLFVIWNFLFRRPAHVTKRSTGFIVTGKCEWGVKGSIRWTFGLIRGSHGSRSGWGWGWGWKGKRRKTVLGEVGMKERFAGSDSMTGRETEHSLKIEIGRCYVNVSYLNDVTWMFVQTLNDVT